MGQEDYRALASFLRRFILRARFVKGMEGLGLVLASALILFALGLGVQAAKGVFPYAPFIYTLLTLIILAALLAWTLYQCFRKFSREGTARYIEEKHPPLRNNLINSLQLYPQLAEIEKSEISAAMVLALLRVTRSQLQKIQVKDLISKDRIKAEGRLLGLLLVPVLALVLFNPASVPETFSLLIHPLRDLPPSETFIEVEPKGARLVRGSSLQIRASAAGAIPKTMDLVIRFKPAETEEEKLSMDPTAEGRFATTLQGVQNSLQYRVAAGSFASPWYQLEAVDAPEVGNLKFTIYSPQYTGLPTKTVEGGNIDGIKGSNVTLHAESNKELAKAKIVLDRNREVPLKIQGKELQGSLVLLQSETYQILAEDSLGFQNSPITYELRALTDNFPSVELKRPTEDLEVNGDETLVLEYSAKDDFGIQDVFLVTKVRGDEQKVRIRKDGNEKLLSREEYQWDVSQLELKEGDEVAYYIEVSDNDTISGPKVGSSRALKLRLKDLKAEHKQVAERIHDLSNQMIDLLADHLERDPSMNPDASPDAQTAKSDLGEKAQRMIDRIDKIMEKTEIDRLSDFSTWSDLRALKRNLEFTKDDLLKQLAKAASEQDRTRINDEIASELERMSLLAEDMSKRLKAQEVANSAENLMKTQERLLDSLGKLQSGDKDLDAVLEELSRMARQLSELQQAMAQMASNLPQEFMNSDAVQDLDFNQMRSGLEEIRKKLQEGDIEGARQLARELFNQMASMVAALRNAHQSSMSSTMGRMQGEMMRSASELQRIVREQQALLQGTEQSHKESQDSRETVLKKKLDAFQAKAQQDLLGLAQLFPEQEGGSERGPGEGILDENTMNNLAKAMAARLRKKEFDKLGEIIALTRAELKKNHSKEQEQKVTAAETALQGIEQELGALLEAPKVPLTPEQKQAIADLSQRQGLLQEQTQGLHDKFTPLFQLFPSLDPKILKDIQEAAGSMGEAKDYLGAMQAKEAIPPEQTALEKLLQSSQQMQNSMQQLAQRGQLGRMPVTFLFRRGRFLPSGRLVPLPGMPKFPEFDAQGGITGLDKERFELPGKEDYRVPRKFREEILESLKQGVPDQFKDQIENYFKDLSQ